MANINSLNSMKKDESNDDEKPPTYFAGGDRSAIAVEGQGSQKKDKLVEDILKMAKETAHEMGQESSKPVQKKSVFGGTGYSLSGENPAGSTSAARASSSVNPRIPQLNESSEDENEHAERTLTFWKNGFSVEDGPLMSYDDPKNKMLLEQIKSGLAPLSLFNLKQNQRAHINVAHRASEDYIAPKKKLIPFQGQGNRLGSVVSSEAASSSKIESSSSPPASMVVDPNLPVTSIQIRLIDGTRLVSKFNTKHTIGDLRKFVKSSHIRAENFILQTTFPNKVLDNDSLTLEQAGILGAVVIQKNV